jgi:HAD superfamily hydrolase (TIGR01509 family)
MEKIQLVAFDCDGVMFDTEKANKAFYNHILSHFGQSDMTDQQFAYASMHTADKVLAYLFNGEKGYKAAQKYRHSISYMPFIKYMEMEPDLIPLLKRLRPKYKTAIATNRTDSIDHVLKEFGLEAYFDMVVSALDVEHPKPHPEALLKILEHYRIAPHQALYVGDSELDEIAARAAGMYMVAYGNRSLQADFHIDHLAELAAILEAV